MKAIKSKALLACLSLFVMMNGYAAEESEQSQATEENVLINSRPLSAEKTKLMSEKRKAELERIVNNSNEKRKA